LRVFKLSLIIIVVKMSSLNANASRGGTIVDS